MTIFICGAEITENANFNDITSGNFSNKTFRYNIASNEWEEIADYPVGTYFSAAAGCPLNDSVLVSGGYSGWFGSIQADVYAYDSKANLWLSKPPMNHKRYRHVMKLVQDKLYAIGGITTTGDIEMFDIITDQWTIVEGMTLKGYMTLSGFWYQWVAGPLRNNL